MPYCELSNKVLLEREGLVSKDGEEEGEAPGDTSDNSYACQGQLIITALGALCPSNTRPTALSP